MRKREQLRDREYRAAYADSYLDSLIATQLRVLREQRGLSQKELAVLAGMKQSRISTMENVNYCSWTVGTLKRLAQVFDLPLVVRFESFGDLMGESATLTRANLERPAFDEDPVFASSNVHESGDGVSVVTVRVQGADGDVSDAHNRFSLKLAQYAA